MNIVHLRRVLNLRCVEDIFSKIKFKTNKFRKQQKNRICELFLLDLRYSKKHR